MNLNILKKRKTIPFYDNAIQMMDLMRMDLDIVRYMDKEQ